MILFKDKIWVHRVNSISKLNQVATKFQGVELDVVYDLKKEEFDVNHPPAASINLKLDTYFKSQKVNKIQYWIDFKNLNKENSSSSLKKLDEILNLRNIKKSNLIIESKDPKALILFFKAGYRVSYYLPGNLNTKRVSEKDNIIKEISKNLQVNSELYISSNYKDYDILNEHFPYRKKLYWFLGGYGNLSKFEARMILLKTLIDPRVEVVLLPFHTSGDR